MKILISDPLAKEGVSILKAEPEFIVEEKTGLKPEQLKEFIQDADALIVRSQTTVTSDLINAAQKLRVIARAGVGVDNVDVEAATKKGIVVMNTPGGNTLSTAEHTFSMMLALSRNIPQANASMREGKWDRKKYTGVELCGKTLGVIGLGRIGLEVAKRAIAFQMKVIASDPFLSPEKASKYDIEPVDLDTLYSRADYISIHTPMTSDTKGMINAEVIQKMKKGVRIINCARGGIIKEKDLYDALISGWVAGAALDVYEEEPPTGSPLLDLPNVIATPHLGAATAEAQINVAIEIAHQVIQALKHSTILNAVNAPSLDSELMKQLGPLLLLGEKLGLMLAQLLTGHLKKIIIKYEGNVSEFDVRLISLSVIKGLLGHALQESVTIVNAPVLAKERGIQLEETKSAVAEDFADLIHVEALSNNEAVSVAGTLFGKKKEPRIVWINNYRVDAEPTGYLLVLSNDDKPGMVARISAILENNQINIAAMTVGRDKPGGRAVTVINVDSAISDPALAQIAKVKHVIGVKSVIFK
ncbi:MAG: phosphoglycerate dehydrogenase [Chlamydiota bacterium]|nr:phosphoglycerate dehydrogenase [Chlamydiota bacterium]